MVPDHSRREAIPPLPAPERPLLSERPGLERGKPSHISHMRPVPVWNCPPWACSPAATRGSHTPQPPGMKRPISAACFITEGHEPWSTLFYIQSLSVFLLSHKQFDGFRGLLQHGGTEAALHRPPLLCPPAQQCPCADRRSRPAEADMPGEIQVLLPSRGNISSSCCTCCEGHQVSRSRPRDAPGEALAELPCSAPALTGSCFFSLLRRGPEAERGLGPGQANNAPLCPRQTPLMCAPGRAHPSLPAAGRARWPGGDTTAKFVSLVP